MGAVEVLLVGGCTKGAVWLFAWDIGNFLSKSRVSCQLASRQPPDHDEPESLIRRFPGRRARKPDEP
jgi:hypothetical protein